MKECLIACLPAAIKTTEVRFNNRLVVSLREEINISLVYVICFPVRSATVLPFLLNC